MRYEIRAAIRLLAWLREREASLETCTQSDIDQWLSSEESGRHAIRNFLVWVVSRGHAHNITAPTHHLARPGNAR